MSAKQRQIRLCGHLPELRFRSMYASFISYVKKFFFMNTKYLFERGK